MRIPTPAADLLKSSKLDDEPASQAFPLVTIDNAGFPHFCFLSAAQVRVQASGEHMAVSIAGQGTASNLLKRRRGTLLAVGGETAHCLKCTVVRDTVTEGRAGFLLELSDYKADSAGVELGAMMFRFSAELASDERWSLDQLVIASFGE